MSFSSISRAATDPQLMARVTSAVHKELLYSEALASTDFGKRVQSGVATVQPLMWPVAVDTEAAYETALLAGRGAPGHDTDIITDGAITSAVIAHWPYAEGEEPLDAPLIPPNVVTPHAPEDE